MDISDLIQYNQQLINERIAKRNIAREILAILINCTYRNAEAEDFKRDINLLDISELKNNIRNLAENNPSIHADSAYEDKYTWGEEFGFFENVKSRILLKDPEVQIVNDPNTNTEETQNNDQQEPQITYYTFESWNELDESEKITLYSEILNETLENIEDESNKIYTNIYDLLEVLNNWLKGNLHHIDFINVYFDGEENAEYLNRIETEYKKNNTSDSTRMSDQYKDYRYYTRYNWLNNDDRKFFEKISNYLKNNYNNMDEWKNSFFYKRFFYKLLLSDSYRLYLSNAHRIATTYTNPSKTLGDDAAWGAPYIYECLTIDDVFSINYFNYYSNKKLKKLLELWMPDSDNQEIIDYINNDLANLDGLKQVDSALYDRFYLENYNTLLTQNSNNYQTTKKIKRYFSIIKDDNGQTLLDKNEGLYDEYIWCTTNIKYNCNKWTHSVFTLLTKYIRIDIESHRNNVNGIAGWNSLKSANQNSDIIRKFKYFVLNYSYNDCLDYFYKAIITYLDWLYEYCLNELYGESTRGHRGVDNNNNTIVNVSYPIGSLWTMTKYDIVAGVNTGNNSIYVPKADLPDYRANDELLEIYDDWTNGYVDFDEYQSFDTESLILKLIRQKIFIYLSFFNDTILNWNIDTYEEIFGDPDIVEGILYYINKYNSGKTIVENTFEKEDDEEYKKQLTEILRYYNIIFFNNESDMFTKNIDSLKNFSRLLLNKSGVTKNMKISIINNDIEPKNKFKNIKINGLTLDEIIKNVTENSHFDEDKYFSTAEELMYNVDNIKQEFNRTILNYMNYDKLPEIYNDIEGVKNNELDKLHLVTLHNINLNNVPKQIEVPEGNYIYSKKDKENILKHILDNE